jgi:NADH-quinone oxidoreductase subunit H
MEQWLNILLTILGILFFPGIGFCIGLALFDEWLDRKFYAALQDRVGPLHTGFKGILQPLADFLKLLAKEDVEPSAANKWGMRITSITALILPLVSLLFVPIIGPRGLVSFDGDLLLLAFLATLLAITIFLAGWFSANRLAMPGTMRAAAQLLSYEIPMLFAMFATGLRTGTLQVSEIVAWQLEHNRPVLFSLPMVVLFVIFLLSLQAELERSPFDIPVAETEIVGGWEVEYSGKKLAFFHLSTDLYLLYGAGIGTALFLGGPIGLEMFIPSFANVLATTPGYHVWPILYYTAMFVIKTTTIVIILATLRALMARLRIEQFLLFSWRWMIPICLVSVLVAFFWIPAMDDWVWAGWENLFQTT